MFQWLLALQYWPVSVYTFSVQMTGMLLIVAVVRVVTITNLPQGPCPGTCPTWQSCDPCHLTDWQAQNRKDKIYCCTLIVQTLRNSESKDYGFFLYRLRENVVNLHFRCSALLYSPLFLFSWFEFWVNTSITTTKNKDINMIMFKTSMII